MTTVAVMCGTEMYTIKSQSRCPSGSPGCQVILYRMSNRPLYRQEPKIVTSLLWRCCPGYGGDNCDDEDPRSSAEEPAPSGIHSPPQQLRSDPNRVQNDFNPLVTHDAAPKPDHVLNLYQTTSQPSHAHHPHPTAPQPGHAYDPDTPASQPGHHHKPHQTPPQPDHSRHHTGTHENPQRHAKHHPTVFEEAQTVVLPYPDMSAALPVPHMMALVMSQLQPVLEGFNRSLEHLNRQVGALAHDVARLKSSQLEAELRAELQTQTRAQDEAAEETRLESRLQEAFDDIRDVRRQLELQRSTMESRLHSQHAMLHYNLTSFKTDIDMKLKRHQKMLQISLQAMNATLSEFRLEQDLVSGQDHNQDHNWDQDQDRDQDRDPRAEERPAELLPPPSLSLPSSEASALWEAIERLDNKVVNNTIKVDGLLEEADVSSGRLQRLRAEVRVLDERINQTGRNGQVLFMETGLEVEAAKVAVLSRVGELAGNLSLQGQRLQEMDVDVDYLYTAIYRHNASQCDCAALKAGLAHLQGALANVSELANDNRMALEEEGGAGHWDSAGNWEPAVEALQLSLKQVKESLASERSRAASVETSVSRLSGSVSAVSTEVSGLKEVNRRLVEDRNHLLGSFNSLLNDAIRHSDVLELLLGEEVLEFLEWAAPDQEAYAIPTLKEQLRLLHQQLAGLNLSLSSALGHPLVGRDEVPSADQPSSSSPWRGGGGGPARERQLLLSDGSDLWRLEKTVEELKLQLAQAEERGRQQAALQAEVTWLKRGLEDHLRVFKNVFSNAEVLATSHATLELDRLWQLLRTKDGKRDKKRGAGGGGGRGGGGQRSKRALSAAPSPHTLFSGSPRGVSNGLVTFQAQVNRDHFYSDAAATFTAPVGGVYIFSLTLRPARSGGLRLNLRRLSGGAATPLLRTEGGAGAGPEPLTRTARLLLREGEALQLEMGRGSWAESADNALRVVLLPRYLT